MKNEEGCPRLRAEGEIKMLPQFLQMMGFWEDRRQRLASPVSPLQGSVRCAGQDLLSPPCLCRLDEECPLWLWPWPCHALGGAWHSECLCVLYPDCLGPTQGACGQSQIAGKWRVLCPNGAKPQLPLHRSSPQGSGLPP